MSYKSTNWTCLSPSLNQGQETITPFGQSSTVINAPNIFMYGNPSDTVATISASGYFNPVATELSVGDWIIGNGSDDSFILSVESIVDGVVTVTVIISGGGSGGTYYAVANDLSETVTAKKPTLLANIGLGSSFDLIIDENDFSGGLYTLPNPCPNFIFVNSTSPGNAVRLPPVNAPQSFITGQGPVFFIQNGFEGIDVQDSGGAVISPLVAPACEQFILQDNATPEGLWFVRSFVSTVNNLSGAFNITSDDSSVNISTSTGNIDLSVSPGSSTLQTAYDNGNGEIVLSANKTLTVLNQTISTEVNGVTTPGTGTNTVSNYRVLGWTFTPSIDMTVHALQYDDALFTGSETRETGIFDKVSQELLGSVFIAKTDPLDPSTLYRTKTLDTPIQLNAGQDYVFATVVPSGQSDHTNADAVPDANVVISQRAELPSSLTLIPLSYPESFTNVDNYVHVGSFQYESTVTDDAFTVNDATTDDSLFMEVTSTTKGTIPAPKMSTAQRGAIAAPVTGLTILNSSDSPIRYNVYDGAAWQEVAYVSEIPSIPPAFGEMYFQANALATTISAMDTPVKVNATYNSGILSGFTQASGTLTYTDVNSRTVLVTCDLTATYPGTSNNTSFYIAQNGVVVAKSQQSSYIGAVTPANEPNPVQCMLSLVQNDTIEVWVANNTNTDDITVTDLNLTVITLSGIADASIILAGENYLSLSGDTLTANPVNLATSNVTGLLPFANVQNISSGKVLGRYSAGSGSIQQLNTPFGITVTGSGDLIWDYNYGNVAPGTLAVDANVSSVTQTGAFYFEQTGSISGAIVNGTIQFTFTSTSTLPSIRVTYPVLPGGLSVNAVNVTGSIHNSSIPTVADGCVLNSTANPTYFTIEMITAAASTYVATVYYQYRLV